MAMDFLAQHAAQASPRRRDPARRPHAHLRRSRPPSQPARQRDARARPRERRQVHHRRLQLDAPLDRGRRRQASHPGVAADEPPAHAGGDRVPAQPPDTKILFSGPEQVEKIESVAARCPNVLHKVAWGMDEVPKGWLRFDDLIARVERTAADRGRPHRAVDDLHRGAPPATPRGLPRQGPTPRRSRTSSPGSICAPATFIWRPGRSTTRRQARSPGCTRSSAAPPS